MRDSTDIVLPTSTKHSRAKHGKAEPCWACDRRAVWEDMGYKYCAEHKKRLAQTLAGELDSLKRVRAIRRKCTGCKKGFSGTTATCETCRSRRADRRRRQESGAIVAGMTYKCKGRRCQAMLTAPEGSGPLTQYCPSCLHRRILRQNRESKRRKKAAA